MTDLKTTPADTVPSPVEQAPTEAGSFAARDFTSQPAAATFGVAPEVVVGTLHHHHISLDDFIGRDKLAQLIATFQARAV